MKTKKEQNLNNVLGPQFEDPDEQEAIRRRTEVIEHLTSMGFPINTIHVNEHGQAKIHYRIGNWIAKYSGGQIDVAHARNPDRSIDMINVYDYEKGQYKRMSPKKLHNKLQRWIDTQGQTYLENT
jgi:hypothetical protein